jgi:hypothetical protein
MQRCFGPDFSSGSTSYKAHNSLFFSTFTTILTEWGLIKGVLTLHIVEAIMTLYFFYKA